MEESMNYKECIDASSEAAGRRHNGSAAQRVGGITGRRHSGNSLVSNINFDNLDSPYRTFQMCEVRLQYQGQSLLFVCLYRPPPSKKNKLTPKMFVDDVEDLIDTLVPLPKFTLLGDINLWYDSVSDHYACTLKSKLSDRNLSQLVNVPTQKKGHILDWIITNQPEDIIDLTVVDKQISDHFLISFSLRLCKPRRRTREVTSRKLKDIDLDVFKADVTTSLSIISPDAGDQAAQLNTCQGELLDLHAPLTTRRVTDRTSAPWMTLDIKAAKQERRRTERQWQQTGLTVHHQIYCHERNVVSCTIRFAESVRNLGVFLDKTLSMDVHVKFLSRVLNFQLKRLSKLRPFLTTDAANKLALAFIAQTMLLSF
ncbi:hypothetical protein ACOMHN_058600 [Nucella lapillus]